MRSEKRKVQRLNRKLESLEFIGRYKFRDLDSVVRFLATPLDKLVVVSSFSEGERVVNIYTRHGDT